MEKILLPPAVRLKNEKRPFPLRTKKVSAQPKQPLDSKAPYKFESLQRGVHCEPAQLGKIAFLMETPAGSLSRAGRCSSPAFRSRSARWPPRSAVPAARPPVRAHPVATRSADPADHFRRATSAASSVRRSARLCRRHRHRRGGPSPLSMTTPICRNSSSSGPAEADRWPRLSYALPTETSEPEAPRMNRRRFEFNADLGDRVPLHVAHDQFHRAEARSVSNRGCPA